MSHARPGVPSGARLVSRINAVVGAALAVSALTCYGAWADEVRRPGHHGEVVFFWLYAAWALPTGIAFLVAAWLLRGRVRGAWWYLTQLVALLAPIWVYRLMWLWVP